MSGLRTLRRSVMRMFGYPPSGPKIQFNTRGHMKGPASSPSLAQTRAAQRRSNRTTQTTTERENEQA